MKRTTLLPALVALVGSLAIGQAAQAADNAASPAAEAQAQAAGADEAMRKSAEATEARRRAALEKAKERQQKQQAWEARCVIRPAMSDEEIATCREVRTRPAP